MRVHQLHYQDMSHLREWMQIQSIPDANRLLIQIFSSSLQNSSIQPIVDLLAADLPQAAIIGCTSAGEIVDGCVHEQATVISIIEFDQVNLVAASIELPAGVDEHEAGTRLAHRLAQPDMKAMIVFTDQLERPDQFLKGIEDVHPNVILAGGIAAASVGRRTLITGNKLLSGGAVGISLSGPNLIANNAYSLNWNQVGKRFTVTHAEEKRLYTIDHKNIIDLYRNYLGDNIAEQLVKKSKNFPLILQKEGIEICRDVIEVHEDGSVTLSGRIEEGDAVRFGFGDPELIVDRSKRLVEELMSVPSEAIFIYSCEARKMFIFNSIGYEISPLQQLAPTVGFFTNGEFYHNQRSNVILNHSMTLLVLSECHDMPKRAAEPVADRPAQWGELDVLKAMSHVAQVSTDELFELNAHLEESEQRYRSLVQYNPDIVYSINAHGDILTRNGKFLDILGYQEHEVNSVYELVAEPDFAFMKHAIEQAYSGKPQTFEISLSTHNGTPIPLMITKIPIVVNQTIVGVYGIAKDISAWKEAEKQITYMAYHDMLTDLPNRTMLHNEMDKLLAEQQTEPSMFACMFLDLDNFKEINDTFGHFAGDQLLRQLANDLVRFMKHSGIAARFGGDEFAILMKIDNPQEAEGLAERIVRYFEQPINVQGIEHFITTSIGISIYPQDGADSETLLKNADLAMYKAKQSGKNRYQLYNSEICEIMREKRALVSELRKAIQEEELNVYYQPLFDLKSRELIGAEALVRWFPKGKDSVPPSVFIPIAEEYGLIDQLGYWVLRTASEQLVSWQNTKQSLIMSVNVSYQQFGRSDFVESVRNVLQMTKMPPHSLHLEITESTALINLAHTKHILHQLQMSGVSIAMDDFGTGYSSLSCVKDLSIDKLKIDRSFITNISTDERDAAIVKTIIALSRNLRMKVLAEGVELPEQLEKLAEFECDEIQGYLFSRPLPADQFEALFLASQSSSA
ncbi:diguanylate cyclase (GGDEF)-like protein/PAS domain S-box-containing protein [Paenibacillus phyllosphaerae]|uniref:Diguanylate cyclase (GGDEF)-like protein/PAS domain S-box-containing protein n=1 Tax=Paenibacillus phyllosphaerae TaxID=274593 RepID=A0A7W5AZ69_9BACL|nr:EAL domain-containing protein [Paenibacillus phyllosphaerae]MBB3111454.1 diguanylate cyclase (GGDEF)-like protein/PAS domain S-box-containing protein [Paenibacillus phyllosphaerae]